MPLKEIVDSRITRLTTSAVSAAGVAADIISQTPQRGLLPPVIGEHAGNFGIPFLSIFASGLLAKGLERRGIHTENEEIEELGRLLYSYAVILVAGINLGVESQFIRRPDLLRENALDCAVGFFAIACALEVTRGAREWLETKL